MYCSIKKQGVIALTSDNLARGVLNGILRLIDDFSEVDFFVHGTTSGLNAFLELKGAKMALIVTKGFRDIYEIGRANRQYTVPKEVEETRIRVNNAQSYNN